MSRLNPFAHHATLQAWIGLPILAAVLCAQGSIAGEPLQNVNQPNAPAINVPENWGAASPKISAGVASQTQKISSPASPSGLPINWHTAPVHVVSQRTVAAHRPAAMVPSQRSAGNIAGNGAGITQSSGDGNGIMYSGTASTLPIDPRLLWWNDLVTQSLLERPDWVTFDMETVLIDTLRHSPLIKGVTQGAGAALERIVQQDAAFDSTMLFSGTGGRTNDPVGNTLTTGGPDRLQEESIDVRGGFSKNGRRGTQIGLTQELGIRSSNSTFFVPEDQGDSRLSLSLTQPLFDRAGQVYNERLVTQARIDSRVTWQDMRGDVETRIADVMNAYWRLYESRCHLLQQKQLLQRGREIEKMLIARNGFDASRVELAKAQQRTARRRDQLVITEAEVRKRQVRLATLIGSDQLCAAGMRLEMIPQETPMFPDQQWELRDVLVQTLENRPEIKAATAELERAALAMRVTRAELVPQLNAVINASLSSLNGENRFGRSFLDQFSGIGPGFSAGLQYEMPRGRRAARSRVREAQHQYRQRAESLRESIQRAQWESESALIDVQLASKQQMTKQNLLLTAIEVETVLTRRWQTMGSDGSRAGLVLENLLDAQQRRKDAESEYVSAQTQYMVGLVTLQRTMGTLLRYEGISPVKAGCSDVEFVRDVDGETSSTSAFPVQNQQPSPLEIQTIAPKPIDPMTPALESPETVPTGQPAAVDPEAIMELPAPTVDAMRLKSSKHGGNVPSYARLDLSPPPSTASVEE